jgi:hypothetical protein
MVTVKKGNTELRHLLMDDDAFNSPEDVSIW